MNNRKTRFFSSLVTISAVCGALALAPGLAEANPVAKPKVQTSKKLQPKKPGKQTYVIKMGKGQKTVQAKRIRVVRPGDSKKATTVFVDGKSFKVSGVVAVAIATGSSASGQGGNNNNDAQAYSQTTTTTQLPGGGTRTDIDHGNGSSTTIIHDPHGGKNGGTRTTTSSTDSEGNTTTTTTTTDGSDGSSTTTTTTSP